MFLRGPNMYSSILIALKTLDPKKSPKLNERGSRSGKTKSIHNQRP
jgi:hypothetical protein